MLKKRSKRSNPKYEITKPLTDEELATLGWISGKYESASILVDAYNEDDGTWDMNIVARALIATLGDGGNFGTVPLIGAGLKRKIESLFVKILKNDEKLDMNIQIDLSEAQNLR